MATGGLRDPKKANRPAAGSGAADSSSTPGKRFIHPLPAWRSADNSAATPSMPGGVNSIVRVARRGAHAHRLVSERRGTPQAYPAVPETGNSWPTDGSSPRPPRRVLKWTMAQNVLGGDLEPCNFDPLTGFYRDGCCNTGAEDVGVHTVCTRVTAEFLDFSASVGNDLSTPQPDFGFLGLQPGDQWCLCAPRWQQALEAGVAPPVVLDATHAGTLEWVRVGRPGRPLRRALSPP